MTGRSYSNDQPQSPCSKPENPFWPGMKPIQTRYCSQTGRSSPYCLMRNSAFATDADSPCARSSAIWLDRKSPGRQLDDHENERRDDQQRHAHGDEAAQQESRSSASLFEHGFVPIHLIDTIDADHRRRLPRIQRLLRQALQAVAHDNRLQRARHRADGPLIFGVVAQDLAPRISLHVRGSRCSSRDRRLRAGAWPRGYRPLRRSCLWSRRTAPISTRHNCPGAWARTRSAA